MKTWTSHAIGWCYLVCLYSKSSIYFNCLKFLWKASSYLKTSEWCGSGSMIVAWICSNCTRLITSTHFYYNLKMLRMKIFVIVHVEATTTICSLSSRGPKIEIHCTPFCWNFILNPNPNNNNKVLLLNLPCMSLYSRHDQLRHIHRVFLRCLDQMLEFVSILLLFGCQCTPSQ